MDKLYTIKRYLPSVFAYILCILLLLIPAIWNGYPLMYSDSGTYILSAPYKTVPVDRPIGYSIFVQLVSLKYSLWLVIIVQALVLTFLIDLVLKEATKIRNRPVWLIITISFLVITTGIDNYTCQIMADIWMPIMILCISLLLIRDNKRNFVSVLLFIFFVIASISHYTVLIASTAFCLLLLIIGIFYYKKSKWHFSKKLKILVIWCIAAWLLAPTINLIYHQGFKMARTKYVVFASRLIEEGILQDYLNEYCELKPNFLCPYKDSIPKNCIDFMWGNSALYKGDCLQYGWGECWVAHDWELGQIIKEMLVKPKYLYRIIKMGITSTYNQSIYFDIGMLVPMREGSPPYGGVENIYKHELKQYKATRQYKDTLYFTLSSKIQMYTVIISVIAILFMVFYSKKHRKLGLSDICFFVTIFTLLVLNAAFCGTLGMVADRYQSRVIWLIPLAGIVAIFQALPIKKTTN